MSDIQYAKDQNGQTWRITAHGVNDQYFTLEEYKWGAWEIRLSGYKSDYPDALAQFGLDTDKWYNHQH